MNNNSFFVYAFYNNQKLLYIGLSSTPLKNRFRNHNHLPKELYHKVNRVYYMVARSKSEMELLEKYFINLWRPPYNTRMNNADQFNFILPNFKWHLYTEELPFNKRQQPKHKNSILSILKPAKKKDKTKGGKLMSKILNYSTLSTIIFGGIYLGLIGLFQIDLLAIMPDLIIKIVYITIGLSSIYSLSFFNILNYYSQTRGCSHTKYHK